MVQPDKAKSQAETIVVVVVGRPGRGFRRATIQAIGDEAIPAR